MKPYFRYLFLFLAVLIGTEAVAQVSTDGSGTLGRVPFFSSSDQIGSSNIFQDYVSGNIGLATTSPAYSLDIRSYPWLNATLNLQTTSPGNNSEGLFLTGDATQWQLINNNSGAGGIYPGSLMLKNSNGGKGFLFDPAGNEYFGICCDNGLVGMAALAVLNNKNVGIGTVTPSVPLEVNGSVKIDSGGLIFPDGSQLTTANSLGASSGSSGSISTTSNGNVGIGTTNPTGLLSVGSGSPFIVDGSGNLTTSGSASIGGNTNYASLTAISNAPGSYGASLALYNQGGGEGSTGLDFYTTSVNGGISQARIAGVDDGSYSNNIVFSTKTPGGPTNPLVPRAVITSGGNIGIGTPTPGQGLQVQNSSGALIPYSPPGATLQISGTIALTTGGGGSILYPDGTVQATAWNGTTLGGDYAESVDIAGERTSYEPGDIIAIDGSSPGRFDKPSTPYSRLVAGVYSTKPGLVGRRTTADRPDRVAEVPMAMMGIVPTKVCTENGPVQSGDLLVSSSTPGYAMKGTDRDRLPGAIIGKALASLESGSGVIEVLLSLQ